MLIDGRSGRTLTIGQVAGGARRVAASLARRGFRKRDVFAVYSPSREARRFETTGLVRVLVTSDFFELRGREATEK